jgi:hypothetical protein
MNREAMNRVKVLFLAANPADTVRLHLDREIREIEAKIRASEYRDSLELISRWAVRPDDLLQALLELKPRIVHLSGHGARDEGFFLEDQDGLSHPVDEESFVQLFGTLKDDIRVVLFNACSTEPLAEAIVQTIDCAIGMNQPIDDDAAIIFAASFYRAIGFGQSVRKAFDVGKLALKLENQLDEKAPKLFVREGVDASKVILVIPPALPNEILASSAIALLTICILIYFSIAGGSPVVVEPNVNQDKSKVDPAGAVLEGYVQDAVTGNPICGATLTIVDLDNLQEETPECQTNQWGRFRFRGLPPSTQSSRPVRLKVQKPGYQPSDSYVTLGTTAHPVTLQPATNPENHP